MGEVRSAAAQSLGHLGACSVVAVPMLVHRGLKDISDDVRLQSATALGHLNALGHLGIHSDLVTQAMTERLKDSNCDVRKAASFGMTKPMSVQKMRKELQRKDKEKTQKSCE